MFIGSFIGKFPAFESLPEKVEVVSPVDPDGFPRLPEMAVWNDEEDPDEFYNRTH